MAKGNKGFGALLTKNLEDTPPSETPADGIVASRSLALSRLASGKVVTDRTEFVDPEKCRPWRLHNRDLEHLSEDNCRDLIDAFLSAKKQRIPAIVRRLRNDPDFDYEIIAGVRRWWTVKWLRAHHHSDFDYLVTVQSLNDEEAFRVSDIENRSRKDITDWERAKDYSRALTEFYDNSQKEMADHLNISKSWLTRMLDVARLPDEIVGAFETPHDITVRIARDLKPLTKDSRAVKQMAAEAKQIVEDRTKQNASFSGAVVAKRLSAATIEAKPTKTSKAQTLSSKGGKPMISVRTGRKGDVTLKVFPGSGADRKEIMRAIEKLLPPPA